MTPILTTDEIARMRIDEADVIFDCLCDIERSSGTINPDGHIGNLVWASLTADVPCRFWIQNEKVEREGIQINAVIAVPYVEMGATQDITEKDRINNVRNLMSETVYGIAYVESVVRREEKTRIQLRGWAS